MIYGVKQNSQNKIISEQFTLKEEWQNCCGDFISGQNFIKLT